MVFLLNFIVAFIATVAFAKLFHAPDNELIICGVSGGFSWLIYDLLTSTGADGVFATLIATFLLTVFSRSAAVIRRMPITVYLISGIFPLVPGSGIYYTIYHLITRENALFAEYGLRTFEIAIAITFGILFGSSIPQKLFQYCFKKWII